MTARRSNTANAWETTLTSQMAPTDLTAVVSTTTGGPASPCYLVIEPDKAGTQLEIIYFDGTFTGTTFVTSGIGNRYGTGSAAASGLTHPVGSKVRSVPVSQLITDIFDYAVPASVLTTTGDILYASGASTPARLAVGATGTFLKGGATPSYGAATFVTYETLRWAISGVIAVPSSDTNFLIPAVVAVAANEVVVIDRVRYFINSGTSATVKVQKNGSDATGFTGISVTTTPATTDPADVALADLDRVAPVVTAVSASPTNMTFDVILKRTITVT